MYKSSQPLQFNPPIISITVQRLIQMFDYIDVVQPKSIPSKYDRLILPHTVHINKYVEVGPVLRRSILRLFTLPTVSKYYLKYQCILGKILGILEPISFNYIVFWSRFTTFHFTTLFCWNLTLS
jgi:hypothetical protein